jgi:hypothetical protein
MLLLSLTPLFISFSKFIISGDKDEWGMCYALFHFLTRQAAILELLYQALVLAIFY